MNRHNKEKTENHQAMQKAKPGDSISDAVLNFLSEKEQIKNKSSS